MYHLTHNLVASTQGINLVKYRAEIKTRSWEQLYLAGKAEQEAFVLQMPRIIFLTRLAPI